MGYNSFVKKNKKILNAFTLAEVLLTLLIMGIIFILVITGIKYLNPSKKALLTLSEKTAQSLDDAIVEIIIHDTTNDDMRGLFDKDGYFSIENEGIGDRFSALIQKYIKKVDTKIDFDSSYFKRALVEGDDDSNISNYGNFFVIQNGTLVGFRFYKNCESTEKYAYTPKEDNMFSINDICASIFYDVNGIQKPNKLGYDEFIIPIDKKGLKYNND